MKHISYRPIPALLLGVLLLFLVLPIHPAGVPVLVTLSSSVSPTAGQAGLTNVSVTGSGFPSGTIPPANVTVNLQPAGVTASATSVATISGTVRRVTFQIPAAIVVASPTTYTVSISGTTATGTSFASSNTSALVVNPSPTISGVNPSGGNPGQTIPVAITGLYTTFVQGVTVANFGAGISVGGAAAGTSGPVAVNGPNSATAQIVIDPAEADGPYNVTVTTGAQQETLSGGFVISSVLSNQWIAFNRAGAPSSNLQCFTPNNVSVSGSNLVITTQLQSATCSSFDLSTATFNYTSGYVSMRNFNFLYGTVEFRAQFGGGANSGAWPAVWMEDVSCQASDPTGTDNSCNGQEIDVAEILHSDFSHVNQQIHVNNFNNNDGCTAAATDTSQNFHVYQMVWSPGSLVWKIDGTTTCTITQSYVPNAAMYLKIDMFMGGSAGGPVNNASLPWTTLVDYVKVTQGSTVVFFDDFH